MKHKTFFGKLFGWIGDIFTDSADKLWDELTPEEQNNIKHGSGIVAIINNHLSDVPEAITKAIQDEFPDLNIVSLETALVTICNDLNISGITDIDGAIAAIQKWLSDKVGTKWEWASSALAELITVGLGPGSVFQKITILIEYAYQKFIKK